MINSGSDAGIPLLTEVLATPLSTPQSLPARNFTEGAIPDLPDILPEKFPFEPLADASVDFDIPELRPAWQAEPASAELPSLPTAAISPDEWQILKAEISERISRQVLRRIDFVLEQQVRDSLADVLQTAVDGLSQEIKRGLHHTLEDVIGRAVAQEVARLQIPKN